MGRLFGTDGVRGLANSMVTPELAFDIGRASAYWLSRNIPRPRVVIGKDTRVSADMLEGALLAGICSVGGDVVKAGIIPTPAIALLTRTLNCDAGVVISASHNPIGDNGIKLFSREGFKLPDEAETEIEQLVKKDSVKFPRPVGEALGRVEELPDAEANYLEHIKKSLGVDLSGMKVVLDCAYGAAWKLAPQVFSELGAEVIAIHNEPDGLRINVKCGSTDLSRLKAVTLKEKAQLGIAFDGDADRCLAVDEQGQAVDGDQIMMIFTRYLMNKKRLPSGILVATVMSNFGLEKAMDKVGVKLLRAKVGDRYVLEEMKKSGATLGGEQSGHIIMLEHNTTGDGIGSAVLLARIVKEEGKSLSSLAAEMEHMPQLLVNVHAQNKEQWNQDRDVTAVINEVEEVLKNRGRLLVRPSGTEPLIRVMAEGPDEKELHEVVHKVARIIEEKLG